MTELQISIATISDLATILTLQKECYQTEAELYNDYNIPPITQTIDSIQEEFKQGVLFLKGIANGQIVASVRGYIKEDTAFIGRLMVKKEFQNNKFGQAMMNEIETHLNRCLRYELFTGFKSNKNLQLYQKLGYQEFKQEVVNEKVMLVYLEKICGK